MIELETLKKEENFKVPDGYFDQFPKQVMDTIHKEKSRKRIVWLSSIAAAMALVICSISIVRYIQSNETSSTQITQTEQQDNQIEEQMIDYYGDELAQMDYYNY